jgi:hypothetical protein
MSYCRWSSNNYTCDVYVFLGGDGWTIHVAQARYKFETPLPPTLNILEVGGNEWLAREKERHRILDQTETVKIGLPYDGCTLIAATAGECAQQLEQLLAAGYVVPQDVIDMLLNDDIR